MLPGWAVIAVALGYIGLLFVIASYGDRRSQLERKTRSRLLIYPLSLAIYCTSWTFFGSVGLASRTGYDFLTIYLGPMVVIGLCTPVILRIVRLAKAQNITSIADFIAARYGKDQGVAALVATIAIVGTIPYIALQLKAVSSSLGTILAHSSVDSAVLQAAPGDIALFVALSMAAFAVLFGTRHIDTTEHQHGLMLAIATESIVKLVAFLAVGIFVTFWMFNGPISMFAQALEMPATAALLEGQSSIGTLLAMTLLSIFAIVLLPRQFHVTVVENNTEAEIWRAAWLFPIYLILINLFVLPIALAGVMTFPAGRMDSDMFVLTLPLTAGSDLMTLVAFVGGLSAATAMVIVESVALSIMVSNDIVIPWVLKRKESLFAGRENMGAMLLMVRRAAIFVILFLAYMYYRMAGQAQLASIGLLSFAAIAQLAPAFFGGLIWRRATARGAVAGLSIGTLTWAYTLLLPSFADLGIIGQRLIMEGPGGFLLLRPQALLGVDLPPLLHGVLWSLSLNVLAYVAFSFTRAPASVERLQANLFVPSQNQLAAPTLRRWRSPVRVDELAKAVARYLGEERTSTAFQSFAGSRRIDLAPDAEADFQLLRYAEHLLASAIGAASSRLVLTILLRKRALSTSRALKLLDDASAAIHYNREILQTALDHVRQGIAVFDKELGLTCWNRYFGEILNLPADMTQAGVALEEILRVSAEQQADGLSPSEHEQALHERYLRYLSGEAFLERFAERGLVIEVRANRMPDGGMVITFSDMTPSVEAAEALERVNETLERRVRERTEELTRLNAELARAKGEAEEANISKTRFLAAASHDILQPLNAARLYVTSLVEREESRADARLVSNIDASLEAVEEILGALLDISRLDSGALKPEIDSFRIDALLSQIEVEFAPLAREKGLELVFVPSSLTVRSDRRLLRRLVQNLVSNAIKYSLDGRVLIGCRRRRGRLRIDVWDTGIGIPPSKKREIFKEFHRLDEGARAARGLGLGLSIVERIARMLDHKIDLSSTVGGGSRFSVEVPLAPALAASAEPPPAGKPDSRQLAGTVVLCIDNDLPILDGMRTLLEGWDCQVLQAPGLAEAVATAMETKIPLDCLLVDYRLDDGNGLDAIRELRRRFGADLPAILITADRSLRLRQAAQAEDIQFLNKPLKPAALRALLAQYRIRRIAAAE
jgi:Na+/proline symporter/signal transduction histidine kinase